MWPQWWMMNSVKRHGTSNNSRAVPQYCRGLDICNDSLVPCSAWTEPFPITVTLLHWQRWVSLSAPRGCEQRLHTDHASLCSLMACSPLPCREAEGLQRSNAQKGTIVCWGRKSSGNGKSRLSLCAPEHQCRVKGLLEQQFFLLPQWHQIGREAVWNPIDRLFRKFNCVRNVAIPFLLFELKSWKNEMLFCSERSRSSVILSDDFFVGLFFFWVEILPFF